MNWWEDDEPFRRALAARADPEDLGRARPLLEEMGRLAPTFFAPRARVADRHRPVLERYDRAGARVDRVVYHPAYEEMTRAAYGFGLVRPSDGRGALPGLVKFALGYLFSQADSGLYCPVACTDGVARILERFQPDLAAAHVPRLTSSDPDALVQGAMFMTERAGGSDLSGIETEARREDGGWRLYGQKWFCSNVDAGLILTIARAPEGLTVFLVPAEVHGQRNRYRIERLKDKLGVASMPTGEVVYDGAAADLVGPPGNGVRVAAELFNISRIYNAVASIGGAKRSLREALAATRHRLVFGAPVARQPLAMQDLARLTVELEADTALVLETVRFLDRADGHGDDRDRTMLRILTPVAKLITGKFAVRAASEAMELLGGNGYIEEHDTPRLLRDAQVLPIWEGTTNVLVLDSVRSMVKERTLEALVEDARRRIARDGQLGAHGKLVTDALDRLETEAGPVLQGEVHGARALVERLATAYRAALLVEAGEAGAAREHQVARLYVDGFLVPEMERGSLDLSEGYDELVGL